MPAKIKITCLVDNSVAIGSRCWGDDGLCLLIETPANRILFDTGCNPEVLEHNAGVLNVDFSRVKYAVLSSMYDRYSGGLEYFLSKSRMPTIITDPAIFDNKKTQVGKELQPFSLGISQDKLKELAQLQLTDKPYAIAPGISTSGRIIRSIPIEAVSDKYLVQKGQMFETDQFVEERNLVLDLDKGVLIILGCCRTGLLNNLMHVIKTFQKPIFGIIAGCDFSEITYDRIIKTVPVIRERLKPQQVFLNHRVGIETFIAFRKEIGLGVKDLPAGSVIEF
ncbi:MAG TPA: MBL fold metallo-hydrolase [Anaerolineaceae bacterium]|nr:MBL fold metallo-hydrolase [Anaerolineaceae bacterium]HPN53176.1 MBL fold metallo-hydrolase [Anaerolineaceae bacterium]